MHDVNLAPLVTLISQKYLARVEVKKCACPCALCVLFARAHVQIHAHTKKNTDPPPPPPTHTHTTHPHTHAARVRRESGVRHCANCAQRLAEVPVQQVIAFFVPHRCVPHSFLVPLFCVSTPLCFVSRLSVLLLALILFTPQMQACFACFVSRPISVPCHGCKLALVCRI